MRIDQLPGLNTANDTYAVGFGGFVRAENVDLSRNGVATLRPGRTKVYTGAIVAAWGDGADFLFIEGTSLKRLNADYSATTLKEGLNNPTSLYVLRSATGRLYWSTGKDCGKIVEGVNREWGIPKPAAPAISQSATGHLPTGRFIVAAAYVTAAGEEGPLSEPVIFDGQYGIDIEAVESTSTLLLAGVEGINIYLTTPNGEVLYLATELALGVGGSYIGDTTEFGILPDNMYREVLPAGRQLIEFGGRICTILDSSLVYSDPYSELTDLRENFIPFGSRVTNVGAVVDGLIITTETRTYFCSGLDPAEMTVVEKAPYGGIEDTMLRVDGQVIGEGRDTTALLWASPRGICSGFSGGAVRNITERQVNELSGVKGIAFLREERGQRHYITVLQN